MKTAIFVEGHTELIVVREMLLRLFEYQNISVECFTLFSAESLHATEYAFPNENAEFYFQIINAGSDNTVLSRLLKREIFLWNAGFDRIIGLRDMYSDDYKSAVQVPQQIDEEINLKFKKGHQKGIELKAQQSDKIFFRFAIMETEAWLLGLPQLFARIDERLSTTYIQERLSLDLEKTNPETAFFHPTNQIKEIFELVGLSYDKSKDAVNTLAHQLTKEDYLELDKSEKCASFSDFYATIPQEIN